MNSFDNPLRLAFEAMRRKHQGSYQQKAFANELCAIAAELGHKGFSEPSISQKLKFGQLRTHKSYSVVEQVLLVFCERALISGREIFGDAVNLPKTNHLSDNVRPIDGVWQHMMYRNTSVSPRKRSPGTQVRRSLLIYNGNEFKIIGNSTLWTGSMRKRPFHIYHHATEVAEDQEVFGVYQYPFLRPSDDAPIFHRGICLGVALGHYDFPHSPIWSGRSLLRRLNLLSETALENPAMLQDLSPLRQAFCGNPEREELAQKSLTKEIWLALEHQDRITAEQYYALNEIMPELDEDVSGSNYGDRIFLR